ncbi:hypothetical protein Zmor_011849 [Zophobas morio]|uniref:Uncharacterized protein n=1 Tax=Zophobas morio TaxID=2755281 RepID=A0AA38HH91_9CUCU|nr:hypothetical protein Zmor_011849 [Zophobas morio]
MLKDMLTKEERKLFSKKNINKIKKDDFAEYIAMYEAQLASLKSGYSPEVYKNPIIENIIDEMEIFVEEINEFYYTNVLGSYNVGKDPAPRDNIDEELTKTYIDDMKPIDRQITRELK